ncbi:hypothetical protein LTR17_001966 [Elasticomyces elasticus]|nr:hypothetical protein LTR17_001966 [Elasticomyces elasticus]
MAEPLPAATVEDETENIAPILEEEHREAEDSAAEEQPEELKEESRKHTRSAISESEDPESDGELPVTLKSMPTRPKRKSPSPSGTSKKSSLPPKLVKSSKKKMMPNTRNRLARGIQPVRESDSDSSSSDSTPSESCSSDSDSETPLPPPKKIAKPKAGTGMKNKSSEKPRPTWGGMRHKLLHKVRSGFQNLKTKAENSEMDTDSLNGFDEWILDVIGSLYDRWSEKECRVETLEQEFAELNNFIRQIAESERVSEDGHTDAKPKKTKKNAVKPVSDSDESEDTANTNPKKSKKKRKRMPKTSSSQESEDEESEEEAPRKKRKKVVSEVEDSDPTVNALIARVMLQHSKKAKKPSEKVENSSDDSEVKLKKSKKKKSKKVSISDSDDEEEEKPKKKKKKDRSHG